MESNKELHDLVNQIVKEDPNLLESFIDKLLFEENPASFLADKAIKMMVEHEAYRQAIPVINAGLKINNPKRNIQFLRLRGECKFKIDLNSDWLTDYNDALSAVDKADVPQNDLKSDIFIELSELNMSISNFSSAEIYINKALDYAAHSESSYYKYQGHRIRSKLYTKIGRLREAESDKVESKRFYEIFEKEEEINPTPSTFSIYD